MPDETELQKLLRLKRYEKPAPEYFDGFLRDFHRRQRAELLRQPAWKIVLERLETLFSEHSLGRSAYAMATAVVLVCAGIASYGILNSGSSTPTLAAHPRTESEFAINASVSPLPDLNGTPATSAQSYAQASNPRYVIDARPVSYERPSSF